MRYFFSKLCSEEYNTSEIKMPAEKATFDITGFKLISAPEGLQYGFLRIDVGDSARIGHSLYINGCKKAVTTDCIPFHMQCKNAMLHNKSFSVTDRKKTTLGFSILDEKYKVIEDATFVLTLSVVTSP